MSLLAINLAAATPFAGEWYFTLLGFFELLTEKLMVATSKWVGEFVISLKQIEGREQKTRIQQNMLKSTPKSLEDMGEF